MATKGGSSRKGGRVKVKRRMGRKSMKTTKGGYKPRRSWDTTCASCAPPSPRS